MSKVGPARKDEAEFRIGNASLPKVQARLVAERFETLPGVGSAALNGVRNRAVFAACGIAGPEGFVLALGSLGARIAGTRAFGDHHAYVDRDALGVLGAASAQGAEWIVITAKDAVKWRELPSFRRRPEAFRNVRVLVSGVRVESGSNWLGGAISTMLRGR